MAKQETPAEKVSRYRKGGEGMTAWVEENVRVKIQPVGSTFEVWRPMGDLPDEKHPETGRSYKEMWKRQKDILHEALEMVAGHFKYRLIIFCWPRGEGKTLLGPVLIQLWKFFCFANQRIVLCANSRDQTKFVTSDMMTSIIMNSPNLLEIIGKKNMLTGGDIFLKDRYGARVSSITPISSFSGIVSNITGYAISEGFEMSHPEFFYKVDGSARNVTNALGVMDSTVSTRDHFLYALYESWTKGEDPTLYFSYRCSPNADYRDYWHPLQTEKQLASYKSRFRHGNGFDRYFKNTWDAGQAGLFSEVGIRMMRYSGVAGMAYSPDTDRRRELVSRIVKLESILSSAAAGRDESSTFSASGYYRKNSARIASAQAMLVRVDTVLPMAESSLGSGRFCSVSDIVSLTEAIRSRFSLQIGIDRADPEAVKQGARTVMVGLLKGLPGSLDTDPMTLLSMGVDYIYFLCGFYVSETSTLAEIKKCARSWHDAMGGVDAVAGERYGLWDMKPFVEEELEAVMTMIHPTYPRQKEIFSALADTISDGRMFAQPVGYPGIRGNDLLVEEARMFVWDERSNNSGWFGSPEKKKANGIQDDSIYALAWAEFAGMDIQASEFRTRGVNVPVGAIIPQAGLLGKYGT